MNLRLRVATSLNKWPEMLPRIFRWIKNLNREFYPAEMGKMEHVNSGLPNFRDQGSGS